MAVWCFKDARKFKFEFRGVKATCEAGMTGCWEISDVL